MRSIAIFHAKMPINQRFAPIDNALSDGGLRPYSTYNLMIFS
jgi:hypothetical protein